MKLVTWGDKRNGGEFTSDRDDFINIFSSQNGKAFAGLTTDGDVVTWGEPNTFQSNNGENSTDIQHLLKDVITIAATDSAFAALKQDGSVVAWGNAGSGGSIPDNIKSQLVRITDIKATKKSFIAINEDKTSFIWGGETFLSNLNTNRLIDIKVLDNQYVILTEDGFLTNKLDLENQIGERTVQKLYATTDAFAVLLNDGTLLVSGENTEYENNNPFDKSKLVNVKKVYTTDRAFFITKRGDQVYGWGNQQHGGNIQNVITRINNIKKVSSTGYAFAILKTDGSVVTWGNQDFGGNTDNIQNQLQKVRDIFATNDAFTAIKQDGTVITWGNIKNPKIENVFRVFGNQGAFSALICNNRVDECGECDGDGLPKGYCDCDRMIPDIDGTCHPPSYTLYYIITVVIIAAILFFLYKKYKK